MLRRPITTLFKLLHFPKDLVNANLEQQPFEDMLMGIQWLHVNIE